MLGDEAGAETERSGGNEREGGDEAGGEGRDEAGGEDELFEDVEAASSSTGRSGALPFLFGASQPKRAPRNQHTTEHSLYLHACKRQHWRSAESHSF